MIRIWNYSFAPMMKHMYDPVLQTTTPMSSSLVVPAGKGFWLTTGFVQLSTFSCSSHQYSAASELVFVTEVNRTSSVKHEPTPRRRFTTCSFSYGSCAACKGSYDDDDMAALVRWCAGEGVDCNINATIRIVHRVQG
jgi:hypothetical protein